MYVFHFLQVSGYGLALVGVTIEQDSAYWEIQIDIPGDGGGAYEIMCGVATKKDRKFYDALQEQEEGTNHVVRSCEPCGHDVSPRTAQTI
jgi:hypothetical protein